MNIKNTLSLTLIALLSGCSPHGTDTASRGPAPLVALDEATTYAKIRIELSSSKMHIQTALSQLETVDRRITDDTLALFGKLALKMRAIADNSFGDSIGTGQGFTLLIENKRLTIAQARVKVKTAEGVGAVYDSVILSLEQELNSLASQKTVNTRLAKKILDLSISLGEYGDAIAFAAKNGTEVSDIVAKELEKNRERLRKILSDIATLEQSLPTQ